MSFQLLLKKPFSSVAFVMIIGLIFLPSLYQVEFLGKSKQLVVADSLLPLAGTIWTAEDDATG
jgi:hypothetical protein